MTQFEPLPPDVLWRLVQAGLADAYVDFLSTVLEALRDRSSSHGRPAGPQRWDGETLTKRRLLKLPAAKVLQDHSETLSGGNQENDLKGHLDKMAAATVHLYQQARQEPDAPAPIDLFLDGVVTAYNDLRRAETFSEASTNPNAAA